MLVFRRRLIYWLLREYIKKWGKTILLCFAIGLVAFFLLIKEGGQVFSKIPLKRSETIGVVGAYTPDSLPDYISLQMSSGLTTISDNGTPKPALAKSWEIQNNGKRYVFHLKNAEFSDRSKFTSESVNYNFSDVSVQRPDSSTIIFTLKDSYSPFLITVSRPIFKSGFVGVGEYKLRNITLNGNFIQNITTVSVKDSLNSKTYDFYPSTQSLKTAYMLGEVAEAKGLPNVNYNKDGSFADFPNTDIKKSIDYNQLVVLFYNNNDPVLSDKRLRSALSYATPDNFTQGERSTMPYPPTLWAYSQAYSYTQDLDQAKILLESTGMATKSASLKFEIKTLPRFETTAKEIATQWKKLGIETDISLVDSIPTGFQIFIGSFNVPADPDQYTIWHSNQDNNITHYQSQRIDKLLEDGRKTVDINERKKLYSDFQKYLTADAPATFLYFPYVYDVIRK